MEVLVLRICHHMAAVIRHIKCNDTIKLLVVSESALYAQLQMGKFRHLSFTFLMNWFLF